MRKVFVIILLISFFPAFAQKIQLVVPRGHSNTVLSSKFSEDKKYIASCDGSDEFIIWDVSTGEEIKRIRAFQDGVNDLGFFWDGKNIITGGKDGSIKKWDIYQDTVITMIKPGGPAIKKLVISILKQLTIAAYDNDEIRIFDNKFKNTFTLSRHNDRVDFLSIDNLSKYLASGSYSVINIWQPDSGKLLCHIRTNNSWQFKFNNQSKYFGILQGEVLRIWRTGDYTEQSKINLEKIPGMDLSKNLASIYSFEFCPEDGKVLIVIREYKTQNESINRDIFFKIYKWNFLNNIVEYISANDFNPNPNPGLKDTNKMMNENNQELFTYSFSGSIFIHDRLTGEFFNVLKGNNLYYSNLSFDEQTKSISISNSDLGFYYVGGSLFSILPPLEINLQNNTMKIISNLPDSIIFDLEYSKSRDIIFYSNSDIYHYYINIFNRKSNQKILRFPIQDGMYRPSGWINSPFWDSNRVVIPDTSNTSILKGNTWYTKAPQKHIVVNYLKNDTIAVCTETGNFLALNNETIYLQKGEGRDTIVSYNISSKVTEYFKSQISFFSYDLNFKSSKIIGLKRDRGVKSYVNNIVEQSLTDGSFTKKGVFDDSTSLRKIIRYSPSGNEVIISNSLDELEIYDLNTFHKETSLSGFLTQVIDINFILNDRYLAALTGDGLIYFWDWANKTLACTYIPLVNNNYVVLSPNGLFDASPGAMKMFHFTYGMEIIDLEQLKGRYYEPKLMQKILGFSNEPLRQSKIPDKLDLYPSFDIVHPMNNNGMLGIKIRNRGGGIGAVKIWINEREATEDAREMDFNARNDSAYITYQVSGHPFLKNGEVNRIKVRIFNAEGYLSSPEKVMYYFEDRSKLPDIPKLYAIVAGISDYNGDDLDLRYSSKDAVDFASALKLVSENYLGKGNVNIQLLTTEKSGKAWPTKENIVNSFKNISSTAKPQDIVVVYLSGHGGNTEGAEGEFYYLTSEAASGNLTDPVLRSTMSLSGDELTKLINSVAALKQVLILDACHSGKFAEDLMVKRDGATSGEIRALERLKDRTGMFVLAGSAADAVSYEASVYGQGLLTYSLLMGMKGAALRDNRYVDIIPLFQYASDKVPELAEDIGGIQKPEMRVPLQGNSFDIGILNSQDKDKLVLPSPKPIFVRSQFSDEATYDDYLGLADLVDQKLSDNSYSSQRAVIYINTTKFGKAAYSLKGRYKKIGDKYEVRARLFKGGEIIKEFSIKEGTTQNLADKITENALNQIGTMNKK